MMMVKKKVKSVGLRVKMGMAISIPAICIVAIILLSIYHVFTDENGSTDDKLVEVRPGFSRSLIEPIHVDDSYPYLYTTQDNISYVVFERDHHGQKDIFMMKQNGNGKMSHPVQVTDNSSTDTAPTMWRAEDGTLHILFSSNRTGSTTGEVAFGIWSTTSTDGVDWSEPEEIVPGSNDVDVRAPTIHSDDARDLLWLVTYADSVSPVDDVVRLYELNSSHPTPFDISNSTIASFDIDDHTIGKDVPAIRQGLMPQAYTWDGSFLVLASHFMVYRNETSDWMTVNYTGSGTPELGRCEVTMHNGTVHILSGTNHVLEVMNGTAILSDVAGSSLGLDLMAGSPDAFQTVIYNEVGQGHSSLFITSYEMLFNGSRMEVVPYDSHQLTFQNDMVGNYSLLMWNDSYIVAYEMFGNGDPDIHLLRADMDGKVLWNHVVIDSVHNDTGPSLTATAEGLLILSFNRDGVGMSAYTLDPNQWMTITEAEGPRTTEQTYIEMESGGQLKVNTTGVWFNQFIEDGEITGNWTLLRAYDYEGPVIHSDDTETLFILYTQTDNEGDMSLNADLHSIDQPRDEGVQWRWDIVILLSVLIFLVLVGLILEIMK